mmetsp:Transcript_53220/g.116826  ORF Transcript_53220/g.116826 Transcript_53220/m.116826 type:complete len:415 (+) Transcript_53220:887-2131(+)
MVLLHELLHVLRGRSASPGLVHATTGEQWNDGQHLCTGAQLQDWEQVRVVITQHVPGDTDAVLTLLRALQGVPARCNRVHEQNFEPACIVVLQVQLAFGLDVAVMGTGVVEPENRRPACRSRTRNSQLHPVLDGNILGLAGPPDVTSLHLVLEKDGPIGLHHLHGSVSRGLKRLVVGPVLFRLLCHQPNVGHGTHGSRVECTVDLAKFDCLLENPRVAPIRNQGLGIAEVGIPGTRLGIRTPHTTSQAIHTTNHAGHRGVHNDVAGHVEVGNAAVGINHGELGPGSVHCIDVGHDLLLLALRQFGDLLEHVAEPLCRICAHLLKRCLVLFPDILEKHCDGMAEDNWIGNLHHGSLQMQGQQDVLFFAILHLPLVKSAQRRFAHEGGIQDLSSLQLQVLFQRASGPISPFKDNVH